MAVMNTRTMAPSTIPSNLPAIQGPMAGGSGSPSSVSSPVSSMGGMVSPHQGIGLKPGTQTPPANVLQVVKQVSISKCYNDSPFDEQHTVE